MSSWRALLHELDAWGEDGRMAELWWRDDDAGPGGPELERMLDIASGAGIALALATIPARAEMGLQRQLAGRRDVLVLSHGYRHVNHATPGARKAELGRDRPREVMVDEIGRGWRRLDEMFGSAALPVLVPPWNRIDPALIPRLPEAGFVGLSTYAPRARARPAPGLTQVNAHVDVIDWHGGRGFVGEGPALALLLAHLAARRRGEADAAEPTGLLTHHAIHDEAAWAFLARVVQAVADHPAARWISPRAMFDTGP